MSKWLHQDMLPEVSVDAQLCLVSERLSMIMVTLSGNEMGTISILPTTIIICLFSLLISFQILFITYPVMNMVVPTQGDIFYFCHIVSLRTYIFPQVSLLYCCLSGP